MGFRHSGKRSSTRMRSRRRDAVVWALGGCFGPAETVVRSLATTEAPRKRKEHLSPGP